MSSEKPSIDLERVVRLLRNASEKADVPYIVLARLIGVTPAALSRWVQGKAKPRSKKIPRIAEVLRAVARLVQQGRLPIQPPPRTRREKIRQVSAMLAEELGEPFDEEEPPDEQS